MNWVDPWGLDALTLYLFGTDGIEPLPGAMEKATHFQDAVNERSEKIDKCVKKCAVPAAQGEMATQVIFNVAEGIAKSKGATILATSIIPVAGWASTAYTFISFEMCREDCMKDDCGE